MKIVETQPGEFVRLASQYFRNTRSSMPVVERVWDARIDAYVLHARKIFAIEGRVPGGTVALISAPLVGAAHEGRLYMAQSVYQLANQPQPSVRSTKQARHRIFMPAAPRRRPFALATRARIQL